MTRRERIEEETRIARRNAAFFAKIRERKAAAAEAARSKPSLTQKFGSLVK